MAQGQVGLRFNVDTSQAKTSVEDLSRTVAGLREQIAKATEERDWKQVAMLTQSLDSTVSAKSGIMQQAKQANPQAAENMKNGGIFGGQYSWAIQSAVNQVVDGFLKILETAHRAAIQRASGDYGGAAVSESRAEGETWGGGIGTAVGLSTLLLNFVAPGVGTLLSTALTPIFQKIGAYIGGDDARQKELALAFSAQYKKVFPEIDTLNQLYGGAINRNSPEKNNEQGLQMYSRAAAATEGTGLTTQAFIEAVKQMGGYGIRSETQAMNMAQNQALWSRFTGADLSTIQKFAGQSYRYGGETGAVSTAYGGLMAQNMGKGQFSEFLNSMERILEEGIAKGFVRSSSEIAGNMALLYKLSGESKLWQGEQGAQRLSQMNNAIANATSLQSVENVMTFGVVARDLLGAEGYSRRENFERFAPKGRHYTGTFYDEFQIMEGGLTDDLLYALFNEVERMEGKESVAQIIGRFKNTFGVGNNAAVDIWHMFDNSEKKDGKFVFRNEDTEEWESIADIIKRKKENDPGYASDSDKFQTAVNKMTSEIVNAGKEFFDKFDFPMLKEQARNVADILAELRGEKKYPMPGISEETIRSVSTVQGGSLMGQAHINTVLDVNHLKPQTEGLDKFYEIQERFRGLTQDYIPEMFAQSDHTKELGMFMHSAVADGEFSQHDYKYASDLLRSIETNLPGLTEALRNLTNTSERLEREMGRDRNINIDLTGY